MEGDCLYKVRGSLFHSMEVAYDTGYIILQSCENKTSMFVSARERLNYFCCNLWLQHQSLTCMSWEGLLVHIQETLSTAASCGTASAGRRDLIRRVLVVLAARGTFLHL